MKRYSIVPDMMKRDGMQFFDETGVQVPFGPVCKGNPQVPIFEPLYILIDTFAKKPRTKTRTRTIDIYDLHRLDCEIAVIELKLIKTFRRSFVGQQVMYFVQKKSNRQIGSRTIGYIPSGHMIEYDETEGKVRLVGRNAGYDSKMRNKGKWLYLSSEGDGGEKPKIRKPLRRYL